MAGGNTALLTTPTWAIAVTCATFIIISFAVERIINSIGRRLMKEQNYHGALLRAFEKMREELFMVGILSLTLTLSNGLFAKICVPQKLYKFEGLCKSSSVDPPAEDASTCSEGLVPFMTQEDIHSLHILVFILAAIHIFYSAIMVVIGPLEVRRWKAWEGPAAEKLKHQMNDPGALRLAKETTFVRRRRGLSFCKGNLFTSFLVAFFKQFYKWRVSESDYRAFRSGFIKHHCPAYPDFNFHKFIMRAFEDDCKRVVGIGWKLWTYAVVWILVDIHGWESSWLVYLVPLIIVLLIGAVMQQIITHMANNILNKSAVIEGDATIMPDDRHFGHRRPRLILKAFHYLVFQNAIGTAFPIWAAVTFSAHNCLYNTTAIVGGAIVVGLIVQLYLGLFILPVYALISQMGSGFKKSVFSKDVNLGLSRWRMRAKKVYNSKRSNDANKNDIQVDFVPLQIME